MVIPQQGQSEGTYNSSDLLPFVGKKCRAILNNGDRVVGTLWDFRGDFITLKLKKGLLYSKSQKINLSEISHVEDRDGNKIFTPKLQSSDVRLSSGRKATLYFQTDDIIAEEMIETASAEKVESMFNSAQEVLDAAWGAEKASDLAKDRTSKKANTSGKSSVRVSGKDSGSRSRVAALNSSSRKPKKTPRRRNSGRRKSTPKSGEASLAKVVARNEVESRPEAANLGGIGPRERDESARPVQAQPQLSAPAMPPLFTAQIAADGGRFKVLQYQNMILFGAAVLSAVLMILFKIGGGARVAAKDSLFPAQVVKLNGSYGIINQGSGDGIKPYDMIRLFRKDGAAVEYKGKAYVRKVGGSFSVVEVAKSRRFDYLEVGDVGCRDRNALGIGFRRTRMAFAGLLGGVAKTVDSAAKSLEGRTEEPTIDVQVVDEVPQAYRPTNPTVVPQNDLTENPASFSSHNLTAAAASVRQETSVIGFGVDDL